MDRRINAKVILAMTEFLRAWKKPKEFVEPPRRVSALAPKHPFRS